MKKKVIIDCDVGVDDALALILAFHSPELEVQAVTAVNGNVPLHQVVENIQKVLSLIRPQTKPLIAKGADRPLKGKTIHARSVHGTSGLGGARIELREGEEWWETSSLPAQELIPAMAAKYPDELTLVATGPLTNLALAVQKQPEAMRKLNGVVIMGGAVRTKGNITPSAEFNIFSDPVAADIVFRSRLPMTLVPLDVTHRVSLTPQWMEEKIGVLPNPFFQFLVEVTGYDPIAKKFGNRELVFLHDPLAVGVVIDPSLVKKEKIPIRVETEEGDRYGEIGEVKEGAEIDVCLGVEASRFLELFFSRLVGPHSIRL